MPGWRSDRSSDSSRRARTEPPSPARAGALSCPRRCVRTSSPRSSTASTTPSRAGGPRSSSPATTARRATSPPTCATGSRRGPSASTPAAAWPTSRTSRRRRTSSACASPRSTPSSSTPRARTRTRSRPSSSSPPSRSARRSRPRAAPAQLHPQKGRAARPRRGRRRPRRGRLRARRPGRGPRPVRDPRRPPRRVSGDGGARDPVDLFDIEIESLRWFSTFTQRRSATRDVSRSRRRPSSPPSTARWPRSPRSRTRRTARTSPSSCPSTASRRSSIWRRRTRARAVAAEEEVGPALADHWHDVCAAFHDDDAHHLYVKPETIRAALDAGARPPSSIARRPADRVPRPGRRPCRPLAARGRAELKSSSLELPHGRHLAAPRRRRAPPQPRPHRPTGSRGTARR